MNLLESTRRRKAGQWLGATLAVFLACFPLFSQTNQGSIQGGVFDQTGGAIVGAMVAITDISRGVTQALITDSAGQYVANNVTPGTYTVRGEAKGFRPIEHTGVLVEVGRNVRVDLELQPGEQTQTITVTGEVPVHRCHLGRHGQQRRDKFAALEWPEFRTLAPTAPRSNPNGGRYYRQFEHQRPAPGV